MFNASNLLPPGYVVYLYWIAALVASLAVLGVVGFLVYQFVRDYGWSPSLWFRSWLFARGRRLLWWQRKPPVFQFDTRLYVGLPGSGKTLCLARDAIRLMRQDVRVVCNFYCRDPLTGRTAERIESWFDMLAFSVMAVVDRRPTVFCIDEIHLWAPARFFKLTPAWWLGLVAQRRHYGVGIIGTCQAIKQVEISLRRLLDVVVWVEPLIHPRIPILTTKKAAAALLDEDTAEAPRSAIVRATVMPWWVYGGYSTEELIAVEEWGENDPEAVARIAALSERAREICGDVSLPWVEDPIGKLEDFTTGREIADRILGAEDLERESA